MKLLVCDAISSTSVEKMRAAGIEVTVKTGMSPQDLLAAVPFQHVIVVRSATKVVRAVIDAADSLKLVIRGGVGVDNIDVEYCKEKGIAVLNTPGASSVSVAELAIGYLLALARHIPQMSMSMKAGKWEKKAFEGREINGKTLGIIGCGAIGGEVARRAAALGMDVIYSDTDCPSGPPDAMQVSLEELIETSDYISLHVPLTPKTKNMLGRTQFAAMKQGVCIIQCARGGLIDEDALYDALVAGRVAGVALDVFVQEPPVDSRLLRLEQVIASPHIGATTVEAQGRVGDEVARLAIDFERTHFGVPVRSQ